MIKNRNIANDAQIADHKLNIGGQHTGVEKFYVGTSGTQAYVLATTRVPQDHLFTTIDAAVNACTASRGDVIYVLPHHAETITADSGVDLDVASVHVVGIGHGAARPTITFTTDTDADFKLAAANVGIHNLLFVNGINSQAMMIETSADDVEIDKCEFREGSATTGLNFITIGVADGDSDRCWIHNCKFWMPTAGNGDSAISFAKDHTGVVIEDCDIYGDFDLAGIDVPAAGNAQVDLMIRRCEITNLLTGQHAIQVNGTGSTGSIVSVNCVTDAIGTSIDAGGLEMFLCYHNVGTDQGGWNAISDVGSDLGDVNSTTTDSINGKIGTDTEMADNSLYDLLGAGSKTLAISTAIGSSVDGTTTDTLHGKIGTDTEMADNSLYDLLGAGSKTLAISTAVGSSVDGTTTDTLHGKIGTDTEMADNSLYDLLGAGSKTLALSTAIGSSIDGTTTDTLHGKIGTDAEMADNSLYDLLGAGSKTLALSAAIGSSVDSTVTSDLHGKIGTDTEMGDSSLYDLLGLAQTASGFANYVEKCVIKSDGAVLNGTDDIFTVSGGPVLCTIIGLVTTIIGGASNMKLQITTTTPSATVDLNAAAVAIDNDAVGTIYRNVGATSVFTPSSGLGYVLVDPVTVQDCAFYLTPGTVHATGDAAQSGVIAWYCIWKPLTPDSRVVAAA